MRSGSKTALKSIAFFILLLALIYVFAFFSAKADPIRHGGERRDTESPLTDPSSYCKGFCQNRYQDGFYSLNRCACIDYYPINTTGKIEVWKRGKRYFKAPEVYDGADQMKPAVTERSEPIPD